MAKHAACDCDSVLEHLVYLVSGECGGPIELGGGLMVEMGWPHDSAHVRYTVEGTGRAPGQNKHVACDCATWADHVIAHCGGPLATIRIEEEKMRQTIHTAMLDDFYRWTNGYSKGSKP